MFAEIQGKYIFVRVYCKVKSKKGKLKNVITMKTIILQGTRYLGSFSFFNAIYCRHAINLSLQLDYGKPFKPFRMKVPSYLPLWFNSEFLILKSGESSFCVIYHKSPYLLPSDDSGLLQGHPPSLS